MNRHIVLLVVASLVGCGDKAAPTTSSSTAAATGTTAKAAESAAPEARKEKSITGKFCLGADGTSQDCAISCKVDKDPETCAKWAEKTKAICAKITKAECQEICDKDENPTACEIAKTMK